MICFYRPHPKDEKVLFSQASVHTWGRGGTPVPFAFPGHWCQVLSWGGYPSPRFFPRSLVPGPFQGHPSPRFFPRSLVPGTFQGGTPRQDWGTSQVQNSRASTCYAAGLMPLAFAQKDCLVSKLNFAFAIHKT